MSEAPLIVVQDDQFTRLIGVVLDPESTKERRDAYADFFAHDEPDFDGWLGRVREHAKEILPSHVRMVSSEAEMRIYLPDADAVVVETFNITSADIETAKRLKIVQKFGVDLRKIDVKACAGAGVSILTHRRRSNIACAEHVFLMMLMLARRAKQIDGILSIEQARRAGYDYKPFDRRHTANANWPRIPKLLALNESVIGIIGLGEIGREIALRAHAFGMNAIYHQRTRLPEALEAELHLQYVSLETLLNQSDFVIPALRGYNSLQNFFDREKLAQMKAGAFLINVSRAELVDRSALLEVLQSGHLGGFGLDPQYAEPGRDNDELLQFDNVILTPHTAAQPRFNALRDLNQLITGLAEALAA